MYKGKIEIKILESAEDEYIEEIISTSDPKQSVNVYTPNVCENSEDRGKYTMEKLKFYFENREFETVILFLNENFQNVSDF